MKNDQQSLSRRQFTKLGATALAAAAVGENQMASAQTPASELESALLMELSLDVADQLDTGHTKNHPRHRRRRYHLHDLHRRCS